jgi:hypothetical protein
MKKTAYFLIIILALIIGYFVYRIIPHKVVYQNNQQPNPTNNNVNQQPSQTPPAENNYTDNQSGFSFDYPKDFGLDATSTDSIYGWQYFNGNSLARQLASVMIPRDFQPQTNFGEAYFMVTVSQTNLTTEQCLKSDQLKSTGKQKTISNLNFTELTGTDAGAGNYYEVTSYRGLNNKKCWSLDLMIHSSNIYNYDPSMHIKEFDHDKIYSALTKILDTFKFIN